MSEKPETCSFTDRLRKFDAKPRKKRTSIKEKEELVGKTSNFSENEKLWLKEFETTVQSVVDILKSEHTNMIVLSRDEIYETIRNKENQTDKLIRLLQQAVDHKYPLNDDLNHLIAENITRLGESAKENMNNLKTVSEGVKRVAECLDKAVERVSGDGTYGRSGMRTKNTADRPVRVDEGI